MSNPWVTRDIGRGPIGSTRTQTVTPGVIDINSPFDGVLVAKGPQRRKQLKEIRKTLRRNRSVIDDRWKISQRSKDAAKAELQKAIDGINRLLKKGGPIKEKAFSRMRDKAENAIAAAERLQKYNTPPWREVTLRYLLFEDLLEARKHYTESVDRGNHSGEVYATKQMVTTAVKPYSRAMNLLARIDAKEPPNGDTIVDGSYAALAWPKSGDYNDEKQKPRFFYERLSEAIDDRKQQIAQKAGGVWDHEGTLDSLMSMETEWFKALTAELSDTNRQQINKYLKILWGKSAVLKDYKTQFVVDFKKDEVPPPETIRQPIDTR